MNWEAIGAIGEIIGAMGVIISLGYLATQIKLTRNLDRKKVRESTYLIYNEVRQSLFENEELSRIFVDGISYPEKLNEYELFRFMAVAETLFMNGEAYWNQFDEQDDERLSIILQYLTFFLTTPGGKAFWQHPQSQNITPTFRRVIEEQPPTELAKHTIKEHSASDT